MVNVALYWSRNNLVLEMRIEKKNGKYQTYHLARLSTNNYYVMLM